MTFSCFSFVFTDADLMPVCVLVQMRFCVAVFLAVLQLCSPAPQSDPQLYISQVENDQEKPSSESNPNNAAVLSATLL